MSYLKSKGKTIGDIGMTCRTKEIKDATNMTSTAPMPLFLAADGSGRVNYISPEARSLLGVVSEKNYLWELIPLSREELLAGRVTGSELEMADGNYQVTVHREADKDRIDIYIRKMTPVISEANYRQILDLANEGIGFVDENERIIYCNQAAASLLEVNKPEELIGRSFLELISDEQKPMIARESEVRKSGRGSRYEFNVNTPNGGRKTIQIAVSPRFDDGRYVGAVGILSDVTERNKTVESLRESEQKYRSVVDNIGIGVALISPRLEILSLNRQMREWFPHVNQESKPICHRVFNSPPSEQPCTYCPTIKTLRDGKVHEDESATPTPDGIRNYRIVASPIRDDKGEIIAAIEMVEDVTEKRKIHEQELRQKRFLETLLNTIPHPVYYKDCQGAYLGCNKAYIDKILGMAPTDIIGRTILGLAPHIPEETAREYHQNDLALIAAPGIQVYEAPVICVDGIRRDYHFSKATFVDDTGKPQGIIGVMVDLTHIRQIEESLRQRTDELSEKLKEQNCLYRFFKLTADTEGSVETIIKGVLEILPSARRFPEITCVKIVYKDRVYTTENYRSAESSIRAVITEEQQPVGLIEVGHPATSPTGDSGPFRTEETELLNIIAQKVGAYAENVRALESIRQYKDIVNNMKIGLYVYHMEDINDDRSFRLVAANPASATATGVATEKMLGKLVDECFPALRSMGLMPKFARVVKEGVVEDFDELYYNDARIAKGVFSLKSFPLPRNHIGVAFENVTDKKIIEAERESLFQQLMISNEKILEALREKERAEAAITDTINRYTAMINTVPAVMYLKDSSNRLVEVNRAFCEFMQKGKEEIIGKTDNEIFPAAEAARYCEFDAEVLKTGQRVVNREVRYTDADKNVRWQAITKVPIIDENNRSRGVVGLIQDVTEYQLSRQHLLQADKLAAIGQLAAGVAHEINNPVGYINSNLNFLNKCLLKLEEFFNSCPESAAKAAQWQDLLKDSHDAIRESIEGTNKVSGIVSDLKSFSRVDQAVKAPANINEGIRSTLNVVWNELKYKAKVETDLGEIPELYCMANQINQVFMNLLVNAAHAMDKENGLIKIATRADENNIYITISDNGCGIPESDLKKIFEPFFTTKPVGQGTGLGLSLAYDIIKKHKGEINVESRVGEGTVFKINLPREGLDVG